MSEVGDVTQVAGQQPFTMPKSYPLVWLAQSIASVVLFLPRLLAGRIFCHVSEADARFDAAWRKMMDNPRREISHNWDISEVDWPARNDYFAGDESDDDTVDFNGLIRTWPLTGDQEFRLSQHRDNPQNIKVIDLRGIDQAAAAALWDFARAHDVPVITE